MDCGGADLGEDLLQRIFSADSQTHCKAAQVCRAWLEITRKDTCGPRSLSFVRATDGRFHADTAMRVLSQQATQFLEELEFSSDIWDDQHPAALDQIEHQAMIDLLKFSLQAYQFPSLTTLVLHFDSIRDWSFIALLPRQLHDLELELLCCFAHVRCTNTLQHFNRFQGLKKLRLSFQAVDEPYFGEGVATVAGDLCLPVLENLVLLIMAGMGVVFARDLTFQHVPTACAVANLLRSQPDVGVIELD